MDKTDIHIVIAESIGWKFSPSHDVPECWISEDKDDIAWEAKELPAYSKDLNAYVQFEQWADKNGLLCEYTHELYYITSQQVTIPCRATAEQRCIAFLKTVGKWKDTK